MTLPIDLHSHTTASDGLLSPTELVQRAHEKGIKVLAITDHDTIDGLLEAAAVAKQLGVYLVSGVEFSCVWEGITIHILGYNFDNEQCMQELLATLKEARWLRARVIAEKLQHKGMSNLLAIANSCQIELTGSNNAPGRPHFAEAMLRSGYVKSHKEAFQKWLGSGKMGDIKQHWPDLKVVVEALRASKAWISLAHPIQYNMTRSKCCRLLKDFVTAGGQSIEVANGFQPPEQVGKLANLARDFGLLASAGSDFHRPAPWSELGLYRNLPDDLTTVWSRWPEVMQVLENN